MSPRAVRLLADTYQYHESNRLAETKCGRSPDWTMNGHNRSICSLGYGQPVEAVTRTKSAICAKSGQEPGDTR
jgi:hypothetical protein